MHLLIAAGLALVIGGSITGPAAAQEAAPAARDATGEVSPEAAILENMFSGVPLAADQFLPELLTQVPLDQLQGIVDDLGATIGAPEAVETVAPGRFRVVTATHELPVQLTLDASGTIIGIFFGGPVDTGAPLETLLEGLAGGDRMAYLVTRNGEVVAASNADEPLAVGSAFKLGILAVIADAVEAGDFGWDHVAKIEGADRSLPTGLLQGWPEGSPVTIHTAAALMISLSDNTATDILLRIAGRDAVAARLGMEEPPLSTREFFVLKAHPDLVDRYAGGSVQERAAVLAEVADLPLPAAVTEPHQLGVEWYLPLTTLCEMMDEVGHLDVMHINPGVAQPGDWDSVAYKGGSEIGVLNLTTRAIAEDGSDYCVSVTWNDDAALPEQQLTAAYAGLLGALAQGAE